MRKVFKTFSVKSIHYKIPLPKKINNKDKKEKAEDLKIASRFEHALSEIRNSANKVSQRHYPSTLSSISAGTRCLFINSFKTLDSGAIIFTVCSYLKGHTPEAFSTNLQEEQVDIEELSLKGENGEEKELVFSYQVLAYGDIIIIENLSGSGGILALERLLSHLISEHTEYFSRVDLKDVSTRKLNRLIASKGGIRRIRTNVMIHDESTGAFSAPLTNIRKSIGGAKKCIFEWHADEESELSTRNALDLTEDVSRFTIEFKDGSSLNNLDLYKEKRKLPIDLAPSGRPERNKIEQALRDYLYDLRTGQESPISSNGELRPAKEI